MENTIPQSLTDLAVALDSGQATTEAVQECLIALKGDERFSASALEANLAGIQQDNWKPLEAALVAGEIFSDKAHCLMVSPYRVWRPGVKNKMSLLLCRRADVAEFPFNTDKMRAAYGEVEYTPVIPIEMLLSAGNIGGEKGETFIVPNAWVEMPDASSASPLFDVAGSQERIAKLATDGFLFALFNDEQAQELAKFRDDYNRTALARFWEYSLHEYGHCHGKFAQRIKGIKGKMKEAAFEEWRCDGIMANLVQQHVEWGDISEAQGRDILMSNFMTRFGTDLARNNAKMDHDFLTTYWIFSSLESTGLVGVEDGKISFKGDVNRYGFWGQLYTGLTCAALGATGELGKGESLIEKTIPQSSLTLDDFTSLIKQSLENGALAPTRATPEQTNGQDKPAP